MTTWRKEITDEMEIQGETWSDVEAMAGNAFFDIEFDEGLGCKEGEPFTVWTKNRVYFPTEYDGAESCESVSRHPDGKPTAHL